MGSPQVVASTVVALAAATVLLTSAVEARRVNGDRAPMVVTTRFRYPTRRDLTISVFVLRNTVAALAGDPHEVASCSSFPWYGSESSWNNAVREGFRISVEPLFICKNGSITEKWPR